MAIKALNSVAGFSVGEVPANIILANGDITSNNGTFTANISAGNVLTNNLLYANGTAWDIGGIPGGSNTQVQFNDAGEFGGVSNFTFDKATNILTVTGNIAGTNVNAGNLLTANFVTGVLTTANQPNVTSVGTLTGLVVGNGTANVTFVPSGANGGITATGNITAANFIGNVVGNISGNIVIPGSNTGVVFNDDGNANTSTAFTFNKTSNLVTIVGNADVGNLITAGLVTATGNVTGGNIITGGQVSATGNITGGNISTAGQFGAASLSASGNVTGGNINTGGLVTATGNITSTANVIGGNINTAGAVVASTLTSNIATGTAPLTVTSTTRVSNLNVDYANVADFINVNLVSTGTFYPVLGNATSGNIAESANANLSFNAATGALSATLLTGTLSTSTGCSITGLKITNLTITAPTNTGNVNILNCDITGTLTKSSWYLIKLKN